MKKIKLKINDCQDRGNMIVALANAGYSVIMKKEITDTILDRQDYYVIFEIDKEEIIDEPRAKSPQP
jgi:hypothetical protein